MKTHCSSKAAALGACATLACGITASAQSVDALLDKLVDKGVLSVKEANELREETDKDFTRAHAAKTGMPEWVTSLKLNGDFRGRYEMFHYNQAIPDSFDRHRWRYRARFGVTATMWDNMEVGLRLASGELDGNSSALGGDPISNNQTLNNNGSKKGIFIDLAYARWAPINTPSWHGAFTIGKMENPFVLSDMVFDKDYTPEGAAMNWGYNLNDLHTVKLNGGAFVLDELSTSSHDHYMLGAQARWDGIWHRGDGGARELSSSLGVALLSLGHEEALVNGAVPNIQQGNTRAGTTGELVYNYNPVVADASLTYKLPAMWMYSGAFPVTVGGSYMHNPGAPRRNSAWEAGFTFGKSGKRRTWDIGYRYKVLEGDAWYEEFVDSDFGAFYNTAPPGGRTDYRGGTNIRGHIFKLNWSPYDALTLSVTYFLTEAIDLPAGSATLESQTGRLQVDALWKF